MYVFICRCVCLCTTDVLSSSTLAYTYISHIHVYMIHTYAVVCVPFLIIYTHMDYRVLIPIDTCTLHVQIDNNNNMIFQCIFQRNHTWYVCVFVRGVKTPSRQYTPIHFYGSMCACKFCILWLYILIYRGFVHVYFVFYCCVY